MKETEFDERFDRTSIPRIEERTVLYEAGDPVDRVFFPHSGIISLVVELSGGQAIEAAMIGRDSMLGATAALMGRCR
jgi:CRP-like cAMP-binding protein